MNVEYPYVSGQAMRYYIKETIRRELDSEEFMCVPDEKGETCGDIAKCIQCDLFGFMTTIAKESTKRGTAITRVSPVKVSPAIGLFPFDENSTVDFLTRKHRSQEELSGDIVNVELGTNVYKCGMAVDIQRIGAKEIIDTDRKLKFKSVIKKEEKTKRVIKLLYALRTLADYSKQARLLTDFTPDMIILSLQKTYSHRLQKAIKLDEKRKILDIRRLTSIIRDVQSYSVTTVVGLTPGFLENETEIKEGLKELNICVVSPHEAINDVIDYFDDPKRE